MFSTSKFASVDYCLDRFNAQNPSSEELRAVINLTQKKFPNEQHLLGKLIRLANAENTNLYQEIFEYAVLNNQTDVINGLLRMRVSPLDFLSNKNESVLYVAHKNNKDIVFYSLLDAAITAEAAKNYGSEFLQKTAYLVAQMLKSIDQENHFDSESGTDICEVGKINGLIYEIRKALEGDLQGFFSQLSHYLTQVEVEALLKKSVRLVRAYDLNSMLVAYGVSQTAMCNAIETAPILYDAERYVQKYLMQCQSVEEFAQVIDAVVRRISVTKHWKLIYSLLSKINEENKHLFGKLFLLAISEKNLEVLDTLSANGVFPSEDELLDGNTILHLAIINENYDVIDMCLERGYLIDRVNRDGLTPMDLAIARPSHHYLIGLLNSQSNEERARLKELRVEFPNWDNYKSIYQNLSANPLTKRLVTHQNVSIKELMVEAARTNDFYAIMILLGSKSLYRSSVSDVIDYQDENGDTPLHWAVRCKNLSMIHKLVKAGANRHLTNKAGRTAMDLAVGNDSLYIEKYLNCLDAALRKQLFQASKRANNPEILDESLRSDVSLKTLTNYALQGNFRALNAAAAHHSKNWNYAEAMLLATLGYVYADSETQKISLKEIIDIDLKKLYLITPDKRKKYLALQGFMTTCVNELSEFRKNHTSLDPVTLLLLFAEKKCLSGDEKWIVDNTLRDIMHGGLSEVETNHQLQKTKMLVSKLVDPAKEVEEKSVVMTGYPKQLLLSSALTGDPQAIRLMADRIHNKPFYKKMVTNKSGRNALFCFLAELYSVLPSDQKTYRDRLAQIKTKDKEQGLVQEFYMSLSLNDKQMLRDIIIRNNVKDPLTIMLVAVEIEIRRRKGSTAPITFEMQQRLNASIKSTLLESGVAAEKVDDRLTELTIKAGKLADVVAPQQANNLGIKEVPASCPYLPQAPVKAVVDALPPAYPEVLEAKEISSGTYPLLKDYLEAKVVSQPIAENPAKLFKAAAPLKKTLSLLGARQPQLNPVDVAAACESFEQKSAVTEEPVVFHSEPVVLTRQSANAKEVLKAVVDDVLQLSPSSRLFKPLVVNEPGKAPVQEPTSPKVEASSQQPLKTRVAPPPPPKPMCRLVLH